MEDLEQVSRDLLTDSNLDPVVLARPQVLDEVALAGRAALGIAVGLGAWEFLDVPGEIVSDVVTETALVGGLTRRVLSELDAFGVSTSLLRAIRPGVEDIECSVVILGDDKPGVGVVFAKLILVVILWRVEGECE